MAEGNSSNAFCDLTHFKLCKDSIRKIDEDFCHEHQIVILGSAGVSTGESICVGMLDPTDDRSAGYVERRVNRRIRRIQLNAFEIDSVLDFGFNNNSPQEKLSSIPDISKSRHLLKAKNEIEFSRDQSVIKMVNDTFSQAVKLKASDIHIELYVNDVDVRFRIDGVLQQVPTPFSKGNVRHVCSHIKILAELDIAEHRRAQDGRISNIYEDEKGQTRQIDMRLSVLPGPYGPDLVLRLLDEKRIMIALDELGLDERTYRMFYDLVQSPGGLIVVAGPTASGKTTTLYSVLMEIKSDHKKILTVEDPIEYEIPKVNQKQVSMHMSFADYSRAFMRQNPDVLMIGEVRDEETANIALRAAQMGHLVFTTLHARDVGSALDRLQVLCRDRSLVASGMLGILSQRLVRRMCPSCVEPYQPEAELLRQLDLEGDDMVHERGKGCPGCHQIGYQGQIGVFELLVFNDALRRQVWLGERLDLKCAADFRSMYDDGIQKVRDGITTVEELVRTIPLPEAN